MILEIRCRLVRGQSLPCALLLLASALLLFEPSLAHCAPGSVRAAEGTKAPLADRPPVVEIDDSTWVDHDRIPIAQPPVWQDSFWGHQFHEVVIDEWFHALDIPDKLLLVARLFGAHPQREAVNVNAFDEVPNSTWFTNRNHTRAVPVVEMREGPDPVALPPKPWTITHRMQGGTSLGFVIRDGTKKWLVKLDPIGYPQLCSGSDMVVCTLLHAAGYNVPHNEPVRFRRGEVKLDADLLSGAKGERFTEAELDTMLASGATLAVGSQSVYASQYLSGHVLGSPSMNRLRPGDSNDWYSHTNRRELRGLFVLASWLGYWDTKDPNFLDTFIATRDSLGEVDHYILDSKSSLGARSTGPKWPWQGYEHSLDLGWAARRFVTLGFVDEPWRRAHQDSGIPSVGNFESAVYAPDQFATEVPQPAFREMTDRDGYWGAKIVASFSDAQIAAAVAAAHYDDPRASDYLVRNLIVRRDKIARHWFDRVAPLDFFSVEDDTLQFRDLAVDIGLTGARAYDVEVESAGGSQAGGSHVRLTSAELALANFGNGVSNLSLRIGVEGLQAARARIELTRKASGWIVTRVRHG